MSDAIGELSAATAVWSDYRLERQLGASDDDPLATQLRERARSALDLALGRYQEHAPLPGEPDALGLRLQQALGLLAESLPLLGFADGLRWTQAFNGDAPYGDFGLSAPAWPGRRSFRGRFVVDEPSYRVVRIPRQQWVAPSVTVRIHEDWQTLVARDVEGARWIVPVSYRLQRLAPDAVLLAPRSGLDLWTEAYLRMVVERLVARGFARMIVAMDGFAETRGSRELTAAFFKWARTRVKMGFCCSMSMTDRFADRLIHLLPDRSVWTLPDSADEALEALK